MTSPLLEPSERVLVRECAADGSEYIGTDRALYHRNLTRIDRGWRRISWIDVASAGWSRPAGRLTLRTRAYAGGHTVTLRVRDRSRLPAFVNERVVACRVVQRRVMLTDRCSATVFAHRSAPHEPARWSVDFDANCDLGDPRLAPAVETTVGELRAQLGC